MNSLVKLVNILKSDLNYCEKASYLTYEDVDNWYNQNVGMIRATVLFLKAEGRNQAALYLLNYCQRNIWPKYDRLLDKSKKV